MNIERIIKIRDFMDKLPPEKFNICMPVARSENGCGTVCCTFGWFPAIFPEDWEWKVPANGLVLDSFLKNGDDASPENITAYLGLPYHCYWDIFESEGYDTEVTTKDVVYKLNNYIAYGVPDHLA